MTQTITPTCEAFLPYLFVKGAGPAAYEKFFDAYRVCGSAEPDALASFFVNRKETRFADLLSPVAESDSLWALCVAKAQDQIDRAERIGATIMCALDSDYPERLSRTGSDSPGFLFVRGRLADPESTGSVAVIGTRRPTEHGRIICERITRMLCENKVSVVSGLALGCDSVAHGAALAVGGHTIAVMAHGLQTVAPKENARLAERMLDAGGALVSSFAFGVSPAAYNFAGRDRFQAGLSDGVVMVQSSATGGSLNASRKILHYGRWLAVPYPTERDRMQDSEVIEANLILSGLDHDEISNRLKFPHKDLSAGSILVLRTREDYPRLLGRLSKMESRQVQTTLL